MLEPIENYDDEIFEDLVANYIEMTYRAIATNMSVHEYVEMIKQPVKCARRLAYLYNLDNMSSIDSELIMLAAATLAYGAYGLDEEFNAHLTITQWFKAANIKQRKTYIKRFKKFQLSILKHQEYDLCRIERTERTEGLII